MNHSWVNFTFYQPAEEYKEQQTATDGGAEWSCRLRLTQHQPPMSLSCHYSFVLTALTPTCHISKSFLKPVQPHKHIHPAWLTFPIIQQGKTVRRASIPTFPHVTRLHVKPRGAA
ncbi:hypothetical protein E2C01_019335 [Portunus trituberculatus]|uniref:Uncharacterized protein n=1 Tax=Portunus trituberculatus TaxID=210409 RepID=A0A5B7DWX9_PORTR|nr:hypothetical protein [Portunus trituberculatus]